MKKSYYLVWDYALSKEEFIEILDGKLQRGRLD
jgi:hypothetical protein